MNYIYKITNIINGKLYIGKTGKTIEERFQDHKRASKAPYVNRPLYDAMNKYGYEYFIIEEVECCKNDKEASIREMYWIAYYDTYRNGYNATLLHEKNSVQLYVRRIIIAKEKIKEMFKGVRIC